MKKAVFLALAVLGAVILGTSVLSAAENVKEPGALRRIWDVQRRGVVNVVTSPGEMIRAYGLEKKNHPKAWPLTYWPRAFGNTLLRLGSGANDVAVLPFFVNAIQDSTPITQRFDLPDYCWKKD